MKEYGLSNWCYRDTNAFNPMNILHLNKFNPKYMFSVTAGSAGEFGPLNWPITAQTTLEIIYLFIYLLIYLFIYFIYIVFLSNRPQVSMVNRL